MQESKATRGLDQLAGLMAQGKLKVHLDRCARRKLACPLPTARLRSLAWYQPTSKADPSGVLGPLLLRGHFPKSGPCAASC